jgi:hypothetical protein
LVWFGFLQQFLGELQWSNVAQRAMGPYIVVLPSPVFDHNWRLGQSPKLLSVKAFLSEASVEALHVSVLPRASRFYVECLDPLLGKPVA